MGQQAVINARFNTAGVHQQELVAGPFAIAEDAVAGNARRVLHNGEALAGQLIENGGFAHVGAAHDSYDGFCHICLPPSVRSDYQRLSFQLDFSLMGAQPRLAAAAAIGGDTDSPAAERFAELLQGDIIEKLALFIPHHNLGHGQ